MFASLGSSTTYLRNRTVVVALMSCSFFWATLETSAQDRSRSSKYLKQAADDLSELMGKAEEDGLKLEKAMTFAGGWIDKSDKWTGLYQVQLQAGVTYRFMAAADFDAKDVDIRLTDPDGNVVAKDAAIARTAIVNFTPRKTIYYTVHVRVYDSTNDAPCVCLTVVYKK